VKSELLKRTLGPYPLPETAKGLTGTGGTSKATGGSKIKTGKGVEPKTDPRPPEEHPSDSKLEPARDENRRQTHI
jgi:hypothetical protein